jgi:recombinational DNA repair protein (RecF pathway)
VVFGLRLVEALGHRLRTDACVACGGRPADGAGPVAVDVDAGGVLCRRCDGDRRDTLALGPSSLTALRRLRTMAWEEATASRLGRAEVELRQLLDLQMAHLIGQPTRSSKFVREIERFSVPHTR